MTATEHQDTSTAGPVEAGLEPPDNPDIDPILAMLTWIVDDFDARNQGGELSFGLTVVIDGLAYAGTLISGIAWTNEIAGRLRAGAAAVPGTPIAQVTEAFARRFDDIRDVLYQPGTQQVGYLHLANAHQLGDRAEGFPLRIRLDRISAWTMGDARPSF